MAIGSSEESIKTIITLAWLTLTSAFFSILKVYHRVEIPLTISLIHSLCREVWSGSLWPVQNLLFWPVLDPCTTNSLASCLDGRNLYKGLYQTFSYINRLHSNHDNRLALFPGILNLIHKNVIHNSDRTTCEWVNVCLTCNINRHLYSELNVFQHHHFKYTSTRAIVLQYCSCHTITV